MPRCADLAGGDDRSRALTGLAAFGRIVGLGGLVGRAAAARRALRAGLLGAAAVRRERPTPTEC